MFVWLYISIFWAAIGATYLAVMRREAGVTTSAFAMILWSFFSAASWNVEVASGGAELLYQSDGAGAFGMGMTLMMLVLLVMYAFGMIDVHEQIRDPEPVRSWLR